MMKKAWIIAGLIAVSSLVGCSQEDTPKKEIPVTIDSQKTIQKEIGKLKEDLANVPVANIKGAVRGSISIETEIGTEKPMTALMATDIIKEQGNEIRLSYMVTNKMRDSLKQLYVKKAVGERGTYLTDKGENSIAWERDGWVLEIIPSEKVAVKTLVSWADTFEKDKGLVEQASKWFSLDDVTFIQDIPGENVKFYIGLTTKNPEQTSLNSPNRMYAIIQTDIEEQKGYQINHSVFEKESFDQSMLKSFEEIKVGKGKKAWCKKDTKELYWEDDKFVYHMQDDALKVGKDFFGLEDYKKFANLD